MHPTRTPSQHSSGFEQAVSPFEDLDQGLVLSWIFEKERAELAGATRVVPSQRLLDAAHNSFASIDVDVNVSFLIWNRGGGAEVSGDWPFFPGALEEIWTLLPEAASAHIFS